MVAPVSGLSRNKRVDLARPQRAGDTIALPHGTGQRPLRLPRQERNRQRFTNADSHQLQQFLRRLRGAHGDNSDPREHAVNRVGKGDRAIGIEEVKEENATAFVRNLETVQIARLGIFGKAPYCVVRRTGQRRLNLVYDILPGRDDSNNQVFLLDIQGFLSASI